MPLLLAPAGLARLAHPDGGELDAARAAEAAGTIFCVSIASSYSLEEIRAVSNGPLWLQLYLWKSDEVIAGLVDRARRAGYGALVLTIDVPVVGNRERDIRNGVALPPPVRLDTVARRASPSRLDARLPPRPRRSRWRTSSTSSRRTSARSRAYVDRELTDQSATWERVGLASPTLGRPARGEGRALGADALEAVRQGADAVYVSNHGGRQLDTSPATLDVLPEMAEAVGDRAEILLDGGVRRGRGRRQGPRSRRPACLAGRPWFLALGGGGAAAARGVARRSCTGTSTVRSP